MKFWKFEYEGPEAMEQCFKEGALPSPRAKFSGLKNTCEHPRKSMKPGDGVLLATIEGEKARFYAIGKVLSTEKDEVPAVVSWSAMGKTVFPDASGGLVNWQTKTAFEISPEPAKKYGLKDLMDYYIKSSE